MRIPGGVRSIASVTVLASLVLAAPVSAQTVKGRVDAVSEEQITVGGTRFMIGEETVIQLHPEHPDKTRAFDTKYLGDVWKVRVTGSGRLAERIVLLPYGYGGFKGGEGRR